MTVATDRIQVVPGLSLPFYPMRPWKGHRLTLDGIKALLADPEAVIQPKLNGDRACLAKVGGKLYLQNRHGGWTKQAVRLAQWERMRDMTCLDGEVWRGDFYAFECLARAGDSLLREPVARRVKVAQELSQACSSGWLFSRPTLRWFKDCDKTAWEGVVVKTNASPYVVLGSPTQESPTWFKSKWT